VKDCSGAEEFGPRIGRVRLERAKTVGLYSPKVFPTNQTQGPSGLLPLMTSRAHFKAAGMTAHVWKSRERQKHGQLYCRKVARNFGRWRFLSAREVEHGQFRALFACSFPLRYRMVELHPKQEEEVFSNQPSAFSQNQQQSQNHFTAEDAEGAKENPAWVGQTHAKLGCGGMHGEGG
jgi:hypothetical protein